MYIHVQLQNREITLIDGLQAHLRRWMEVVVTTVSQTQRRGEEVQICLLIMEMFHMLPASTFRLFEPLLALCLKGEKSLGTEVCVCLHTCINCVCVCVLCVCLCMCVLVCMRASVKVSAINGKTCTYLNSKHL